MNRQAPRPAEDTPGLAGVNVVRPRAGALRALTLTPAPAWTGTYPGQAPAGVAHRLAEARDPPQGRVALKTSVGFVLVVGVVLLLAGAHSGLLDGYGASQLV